MQKRNHPSLLPSLLNVVCQLNTEIDMQYLKYTLAMREKNERTNEPTKKKHFLKLHTDYFTPHH